VPIFVQGQGVRGKNQALFRQAWDEYFALAVDLRSAARLAAYRLQYAAQRARYLHTVVLPVHQQLLLQMQLRYNAMFTGTLELLDAARQDIEMGQEYVLALQEYWKAEAQLQQLLAGNLPEDLLSSAGPTAGRETSQPGAGH
jgi:cobalt-zinc-cadmium efflux system outer membrane protein